MRSFELPEQKEIINYLSNISFRSFYKNNNNYECWIIDQKVTFDVLNTVCKCIMNLINVNECMSFKHTMFMDDKYSRDLFKLRTSKNGKAILSDKTSKEYDKLFWNNFKYLAYIDVLDMVGKNEYKLKNKQILKLLSESPEACLTCICISINKLISSSANLSKLWAEYIDNKTKNNLKNFKDGIKKWMLETTRHKKDITQIYQKILNPLFYLYELEKYHPIKCSKFLPQSPYDLSYMRIHLRDNNKPFGLTRREYKQNSTILKNKDELNENTQKKDVKKWNQQFYNISPIGKNEYVSELDESRCLTGVDVHHIWPKNEFNNKSFISPHIHENLILLNQTQHLGKAHLNGNRQLINDKNLNHILFKQLEKILKFNKKNIGKYSTEEFYKLVCFIKNIEYIQAKNEEMLLAYIEDVISQ